MSLSNFLTRRMIVILGVGNVLLSDDGLGVRVIEEIKRRYRLPEEVLLIESCTLGISLLNLLEGVEKLVIVNAIRGSLPSGSFYKLNGEEVLDYFEGNRLSAHDINLLDVFTIAKIVGNLPKEVVV